ncbi:MAG: segregation/condensation protein A [Gammaproteobacteria bacterium]|nr:segregation/condensation protein A [Gammaproteobacteria bacterium]
MNETLTNATLHTPTARVKSEAVTDLPHDLYIPPDALEIFLETFQGPLDLLLYLIKRENLDILDIPIARVTQQYMEYIDLMRELRLELAAEYLLMAAMLAEIKSRMLLPRPVEAGEEQDPRAELARRLLEYERFKQAAEQFDALPQIGRDVFQALAEARFKSVARPLPTVTLDELLRAFSDALARAVMYTHHHIQREPLSVRERMSQILSRIQADHFTEFQALFPHEEGRRGVVVTFLALLELIKESLIELVQHDLYGTIHIRSASTTASPWT